MAIDVYPTVRICSARAQSQVDLITKKQLQQFPTSASFSFIAINVLQTLPHTVEGSWDTILDHWNSINGVTLTEIL